MCGAPFSPKPTLARLAFISRAKQLGCSLEEITDLVGIWDGERCGPVQRRFHDLVTAKFAGAQLAGPAVDGPCGEGCVCLALDGALASVELMTKPSVR